MRQMSLEVFIKYIDKIKLLYEVDNEVNNSIRKLKDDVMQFSCLFAIDPIVDLLRFVFDDDESDWIGFWLWETDFGRRELDVCIDGKTFQINSVESLYKVLTNKTIVSEQEKRCPICGNNTVNCDTHMCTVCDISI